MSITKGSILISNANAVGAELVNQLGGTGYKPVEWADAINLLGISNDDKASALAGITEGTYTGDERGSIKYSNCNAVGSMLNKKFSTDRGFKPVEWESAISKLTPLAEGTVSGSVVSFPNGADEVPTKSLIVTIPPTLSGVSSLTETQTGRNLFNNTGFFPSSGSVSSYYFKQFDVSSGLIPEIHLKAGVTYTFEVDVTSTIEPFNFSVGCGNGGYSVDILTVYNKSNGRISVTFTPTTAQLNNGDIFAFRCPRYQAQNSFDYSISNVQLEYGSTAHDYEPYTTPTTYTANLGRTIYGGTADIVNGEGTDEGVIEVFDTIEGNVIKSQFNSFNKVSGSISVLGTNVRITFAVESGDQNAYNRISNTYTANEQLCNLAPHSFSYASDTTHWYRNTVLYLFLPVADVGTTAESVYNYLTGLITNGTPLKFYLPYNTPTDFTFDGQEVPTRLGYNAFWSDSGDTEVTYRKDPDIPDQPVQLLDMNNNENNDN